jgi:hypothetical protein
MRDLFFAVSGCYDGCDFVAYGGKIERDMLHKESGTIYLTKGFELKWEGSSHLSWLAESVRTRASPRSTIF